MDAIKNIIVSNCIIKSSNRGIGIQNRDEGLVENIFFDNIIIEGRLFDDVWWGKAEPIYVTAYKRQAVSHKDSNVRFAKGQTEGRVGIVSNIRFSDIDCKSENGIFVGGEKGKISNVGFRNINLTIDKKTKYKGGLYDLRPSETVGLLEAETAGFYFSTAKDINVENSSLNWGENKAPYFNKVLFAENVDGIKVTNLKGQAARPGSEPISCNSCTAIDIKQ